MNKIIQCNKKGIDMKFISLVLLTAVTVAAQANLSPEQTIVSLKNKSSKTVEVRIKALFTDIQGKSTKGGGVRVTLEPGVTTLVDLKDAAQRFREEIPGQKGQITEEKKTLRKIDADHLATVEILKIVGVDTNAADKKSKTLFKIFTEQPAKKGTVKNIREEIRLADSFEIVNKDGGVDIELV